MRLTSIFVIMLACRCAVAAENFWLLRGSETWSAPEIRQIVTDSPWAREARVRTANQEIGATRAIPPQIGPEPEQARPAGEPPSAAPRILVRWESAPPIYEACSRGGMDQPLFSCVSKLLYLSNLGGKFELLRQNFYIVSMSNYPALPAGNAPQHSDAANAALERMSRRIQQSTFLKRNGRKPFPAERVMTLPAGNAVLVIVLFPRTEVFSLADKKPTFESADPRFELSASFNLARMLYQGRLAL